MRFVGFLSVFLILVASNAFAQTGGVEQAQTLVVMIEGRLEGDPTFGAGLVVGEQGSTLYVATANHVVRRGTGVAQDVRVRLRTVPGERLPARVLEDADQQLDLAVLAVPIQGRPSASTGIAFGSLGSPRNLRRGDNVYAIGNPNGVEWGYNLTPYRYRDSDGDEFSFEALSIKNGHSGGGVFDDQWRLIGMTLRDQPPDGAALSIERIVGLLRKWGYPLALTAPVPSPTASSRPGAPAEPGVGELREHVLIALKARQVTGLDVSVDPLSVITLQGTLPDAAAMSNAYNAARQVRGVRGVSYNVLVKGSGRGRYGPPVPPDVLQAKIQHGMNRYGVSPMRVDVDHGLNVIVSGSVASPQELSRVLNVVNQPGTRSLTYEIAVVGPKVSSR
jgi:hypothetical protein